jgi:uncharacterized membrane protein YgcG
MALHFLSGDEMSGKKGSAKKAAKQEKKTAKKAVKQQKKVAKKQTKAIKKAEKKAKKGTKPKLVAKVALKPARDAFLLVVAANALKTATKLARTWNKPGGKEAITKKWLSLGGQPDFLKKAIIKGSKQSISGDQMGIVLASAVALASSILALFAGIFKMFGAGGDKKEQEEYDKGVNDGLQTLNNDPNITKDYQSMPEDGDVALVKPGGSGGGGGTGGGGGGNGGGGEEGEGGTEGGEETKAGGLMANPGTICLFLPILISQIHITDKIGILLSSIILIYCLIGLCMLPFSIGLFGKKCESASKKYFDLPASWIYKPINFFKHKFHLNK